MRIKGEKRLEQTPSSWARQVLDGIQEELGAESGLDVFLAAMVLSRQTCQHQAQTTRAPGGEKVISVDVASGPGKHETAQGPKGREPEQPSMEEAAGELKLQPGLGKREES